MGDLRDLGKMLLLFGALLVVVGAVLVATSRLGTLPLRLGRLPGDIVYHGRNTTVYFPIVSCLVISGALTLIAWLVALFRR